MASAHGIWTGGARAEARARADTLPTAAWARASAGNGAQGPRWYDWACLALPYEAADGWAHWLLVRRSVSDPGGRAYYRVHAPVGTAPGAMAHAVGRRWPIETAFADAKGLAGLADDEVRRWDGWYRHVTLSLLAHAAGKGGEASLITLTVPEVRHLLHAGRAGDDGTRRRPGGATPPVAPVRPRRREGRGRRPSRCPARRPSPTRPGRGSPRS